VAYTPQYYGKFRTKTILSPERKWNLETHVNQFIAQSKQVFSWWPEHFQQQKQQGPETLIAKAKQPCPDSELECSAKFGGGMYFLG
jgi:hypothetical protein